MRKYSPQVVRINIYNIIHKQMFSTGTIIYYNFVFDFLVKLCMLTLDNLPQQ